MNFKPTILKSLISILAGIITNYPLAGTVKVQCNTMPVGDTLLQPYSCTQPSWLDFAFDPVPLIISLFTIFLVYLIWSTIQKK